MRKRLLLGLTTCILLSSCGTENSKGTHKSIRVETETVTMSTSRKHMTYIGDVEADESVALSFTSMGVIKKIYVEEGERVTKGQLIALLDDTYARNTLMNCEAQMRQAEDAYNRMRQLHDSNAISEMKWVEVVSNTERARAQLDMAKKSLKDCELRATEDGVVGKKHLNEGETAMPSVTLCTILNINRVKVRINIPEKEMSMITEQSESEIRIGATGETYRGLKIEKGVDADKMTRTYTARIFVDNKSHHMLPGMVADVRVWEKDHDKTLRCHVPIKCVQKSAEGKQFVWVDDNGTAKRVTIELGKTDGDRIEVTKGLRDGMTIIVSGYQKLSENSMVFTD